MRPSWSEGTYSARGRSVLNTPFQRCLHSAHEAWRHEVRAMSTVKPGHISGSIISISCFNTTPISQFQSLWSHIGLKKGTFKNSNSSIKSMWVYKIHKQPWGACRRVQNLGCSASKAWKCWVFLRKLHRGDWNINLEYSLNLVRITLITEPIMGWMPVLASTVIYHKLLPKSRISSCLIPRAVKNVTFLCFFFSSDVLTCASSYAEFICRASDQLLPLSWETYKM